MPNLQVKREILLRRRRMVGERNEERDSERPGRGLVKKRERRPGEVLGAPFERRHLGAGARLSALSPLRNQTSMGGFGSWPPLRRVPFSFYAPTLGDLRGFLGIAQGSGIVAITLSQSVSKSTGPERA